MTDRVAYLTVALEQNIRTDDIGKLTEAILQLRGVSAVEFGVANPALYTAEARVRTEISEKLFAALWGKTDA